jgi:hypothetical protein
MTGGYPVAVGIGDLVIDPGEGASCCPADEGPGLPVQSLAFVLLFFGGGGLWPGHDSEVRQAKARGDVLVRVVRPGGCPGQFAGKCLQAGSVSGIYPGQERAGAGCRGRRVARMLPGAAEGDEDSVDVQEEQGAGHRAWHGVDGTFIWIPSHDQRPCFLSTALPSFVAAIPVGPGTAVQVESPQRGEGHGQYRASVTLVPCPDPVKRIAVSAEVFRSAFLDTGRDRRVCGAEWKMVGMIPLNRVHTGGGEAKDRDSR